MARQKLSDLLGNVELEPETSLSAAGHKTAQAASGLKSAPREAVPLELASGHQVAGSAAAEVSLPTYLRMVRKETRLREDQQNLLTVHARRLNRAKAAGTPRITDNTLIRVAVDLLLTRIETARGDDEESLLESLNR